jgi:hypothetical protein
MNIPPKFLLLTQDPVIEVMILVYAGVLRLIHEDLGPLWFLFINFLAVCFTT